MAVRKSTTQSKLQQYLEKEGVQLILEELMASLMKHQPKVPILHMIQLLTKKAESKGLVVSPTMTTGLPKQIVKEEEKVPSRTQSRSSTAKNDDSKSPRESSRAESHVKSSIVSQEMNLSSPELETLHIHNPHQTQEFDQTNLTEEDLLKYEIPILSTKDVKTNSKAETIEEFSSLKMDAKKRIDPKLHTQQRHKELEELVKQKQKEMEKKKLFINTNYHSDEEEEEEINIPHEENKFNLDHFSETSRSNVRTLSPHSSLADPISARVNVVFCANCAKMIFAGEGSQVEDVFSRTHLSPRSHTSSQNKSVVQDEDVDDEDIESASQVSGPRPMVWDEKPKGPRPPSSSKSQRSSIQAAPRKLDSRQSSSHASRGWNIPTSPNESLLDFERKK